VPITKLNPKLWAIALQVAVLLLVISLLWGAGRNLSQNLTQLGLQLDFDFLGQQASFNIREAPIPYQPTDPYRQAILVGLLNTLRAAIACIAISTVLATVIGIARLANNWLIRQLATLYIEVLRNTPLLSQLVFWYTAVFLSLPSQPHETLWGMALISQSGIIIPALNANLSAEFCALVIGLSLFSATFIAEIWRGSILSVNRGQIEAGKALGLSGWQNLALIILPQALRAMLPPLTSQYLNILKNSSLAIATGFEDLYAISSEILNQTGRPVNVILLVMLIYLVLDLAIALGMNWLNHRLRIVQR